MVALSRQQSDLDGLSAPTGCESIAADLEQLDDAVSQVQCHLPLDTLVNNTGIIHFEPALDTTMRHVEQTLAVNTLAPFRLA